MGVSAEEDGEYVVLRDSRHQYAYRGYLKVRATILHDAWKNIRMLSVVVMKDELTPKEML